MNNPHISSARWAELSNLEIGEIFDSTFQEVAILPNQALINELRQMKTATLELIEDRTCSTVYRIRDTDVIYHIECVDGKWWEFDCFDDYKSEKEFDTLVESYLTPPRTYVVYDLGDEQIVERTKSPRLKISFAKGSNNGSILESPDKFTSTTQLTKIMRQAAGQVAKYRKTK